MAARRSWVPLVMLWSERDALLPIFVEVGTFVLRMLCSAIVCNLSVSTYILHIFEMYLECTQGFLGAYAHHCF